MAKKMVKIITPGGSILEVTEECAKRCLAKGYTKVEEEGTKGTRGTGPEGKDAEQVSAGEPGKEEKTKDNTKANRSKKTEVK